MAQKETAEQKLLKIIEATQKAQAAAAGGGAAAAPAAVKPSHRLSVSLRQVNVLLMVFVLASLLFLGYEVRNGFALLQQTFSIAADSVTRAGSTAVVVPQMKNASYYLDRIGGRNIFQPYEKKAGSNVPSEKAALEQKMAQYKMVGIAWLDLPESATVMLEDTSTHMTRFLKEGDKFDDITVKTIYTDRVVFDHANEEITIKL